ncbi:ABC transporter ATP-binding protein [Fluviicola sp.]|uniref:ABC transporter ATP-binding protein n=1 Tax=Fluviicola sp. TaxID=1917219 RepID=UPI0031E16387
MKSLSYLNKYFYKYRWRLLLGILFIVINNYFGAKIPVIIGETTDILKGNKETIFNGKTLFWTALTLAGMIILFNIIKGFFLFLTRQTIIVMSRYIEFDLKNEIYEKYQELDYKFYKSQSTGDLMNRISEDVSQVRQYLGPGIMYTVNLIVLFPFNLYQMLKINAELTFYALVPLPVMAVLIYLVSSRMNKLSKDVQQEQSRLSTLGQETFSGIRVIKAYIQERHARGNFEESSQAYLKKTMRLVRTNALFMPTISLLIGTSTLLSIYIGGLFTYQGTVTTGEILTIILIIYNLTWPFASVGWVTSIIQRAAASQERINEFLKTEPEIKNTTERPVEAFEEIRFENMSFRYKQDLPDVLSNINFTLKRGESLGIIGKTGSGKSTLLQLIVRQLDPSAGKVLYNKEALASINLDAYRKQISVVPQDVFLFSDTIKNNIAFGALDMEHVSLEEIRDAAKNAHVLHNIEAFPEKFETLLGERGVNLSGGQKQRVSIARALIRKPQILLLDDCLSAVDTETEEIILRNLKKLNVENQTTSVIVSHRISSLRNSDYILVLDDGKILEEGTPEELLGRDSHYREMYEKQLIEETNLDMLEE